MRAYLPVARATFMIGLIYRFGFLFTIFGNMVYLGVAYYLWKSIYRYSETIRGLTFNETFIYVALGSSIFILLKTYADWIIHHEIREGAIATYLTKPIDFQVYALFANLGSLLMNLTAITLPTALAMLFVFDVKVIFGVGLFLFPLSLLLAFVISFSIDYFIGLLGFYSESVWGMSITKEIFVTVFSGALIPLQFFPEAIRNVLFWLPFQAIYHTPLMMITRPDQGLDIFLPMMLIQLGWAVLLFLLARLFFNQAVKVLRIAGG
ncbi:MAG TPA: ABC-2 family transporter protein [Anaerolineales bacterium]|nr:ABC-2 family transporter protein [Anaerolineales bacterium]